MRRRARRSAWVVAALLLAALVQGFGSTPTAAADPPPRGARLAVINGNGNVQTYAGDGTRLESFPTTFDGGDEAVIGNVYGDPTPEVVVAEGDSGKLQVYDLKGGRVLDAEKFSNSRYDRERDVLRLADVDGDAISEVVVGNAGDDNGGETEGGEIDVIDLSTGPEPHSGFDTTFDDEPGNGLAAGDVDGDGRDEILVANKGDDGRIDVLNPRTGTTLGSNFGIVDTTYEDDSWTEFDVGDVDGDGTAEVLIADADEDGRIHVLSPRKDDPVDADGVHDSTFEDTDENQFKVADVDGDGRVEALVANAEDDGRVDVLDPLHDEVLDGIPTTNFGSASLFWPTRFELGDLDGDDIPDRVEIHGIREADGTVALDLTDQDAPNLPANPCGKDVVVEVDWMEDTGTVTPHSHEPKATAMAAVRDAFAAGPVQVVADCPYGDPPADDEGINVIIRVSDDGVEEIPTIDNDDEFARIKKKHFVAALDPYVHYALVAHDAGQFAGEANSAGDGQDFVMTVSRCEPPAAADCDPNDTRTSRGGEQAEASTFMHELGHTLGLHHGGAYDDPATKDVDEREVNCKPNYLSIMNYFFASGLTVQGQTPVYDFSRRDLRTLEESGPEEARGIGTGADVTGIETAWGGGAGNPSRATAGGAINWNGTGGTDDSDPVDLNDNSRFGCKNKGPGEPLTGFDDWAFLDQGLGVWDGGSAPQEQTPEQAAAVAEFWNTALYPDVTVPLLPPKAGYTRAVQGIAVDGQRVWAVATYRKEPGWSPGDPKGRVVLLDRTTMAVLASTEVGYGPRSVAINPVTNRLYVANAGTGQPADYTISVLDARSMQRITDIPTGQGPVDVAVNPRTNRVYAANSYQERILVFDGATNTPRTPIVTGPGTAGLAVDPSRNTVHVALTHRPEPFVTAVASYVDDGVHQPVALAPVPLGDPLVQPGDVAVDPGTNRLYVAGLGGNAVHPRLLVVDATNRTLEKEIPLAGPGRAVAINPDAHEVYVSAQSSIAVVDTVSLEIVRKMPASAAFSVASDVGPGRLLWFGDFVDGTLSRRTHSSGTAV